MSYSTDLTDTEWEIIEPILHQILPIKKATRPPNWTKREILNGRFYQLKKANLSDDSGWIELWNLSVTGKPR
ncbi:hypothetical protein QUA56_04595 [Microcoleus sp. N3A4]|uniref:hypothetical protein n=1 Tax=Microcoleus sp. N3A4 TaxID=3055379 RepID=UPI002FD28606